MLDYHNNRIALWACPRSRSTLFARSFEQRDDCVVCDEPFYAPYLLEKGQFHPFKDNILEIYESDHEKVAQSLLTALPNGVGFEFQKHIAKNVLPHYGTAWFPKKNIFLIRHPKDILISLYKIFAQNITIDEIDINALYRIFQQIKTESDKTTIVINSDDFIKKPVLTLRKICEIFEIPFQESMLQWKAGLSDSNLLFTGKLLPYADTWYGSIKNSTGFKPYQEKTVEFPEHLQPILEACMPIYQKLLPYCLKIATTKKEVTYAVSKGI